METEQTDGERNQENGYLLEIMTKKIQGYFWNLSECFYNPRLGYDTKTGQA